jgi:hypothetical protein
MDDYGLRPTLTWEKLPHHFYRVLDLFDDGDDLVRAWHGHWLRKRGREERAERCTAVSSRTRLSRAGKAIHNAVSAVLAS